MAGYTRQSTADIIPTATVRAAPINAEYNAIRDAFAASGGHKHDGTTGEGEYIPLIADLDALNKIVVDSTNNRFGVFVEVGATAVEQVRFQDGVIVPVTDNDIDLGTSALEFKNLYLDGTAKIDTLTVDEDATVAGTLGVTSNTTLGGTLAVTGATTLSSTLGVTGNTTLSGTLGVTGATTLSSTLAVTGSATLSSTLSVSSNATVGGTLAVTGTTSSTGDFSVNTNKFTVAATTGNTAVAGTLGVTGNTTVGGTLGVTGAATLSSTAAISGNTTIGGTLGVTGTTTYSTLTGANLTATGTVNFSGATVSNLGTVTTAAIGGGTINNTVIGGSTPAAITGTTITGTSLVGPVTGNVTGNITGNVTGNVTASSGASTFNNVTINGTLDVTNTTIENVSDPTTAQQAATKAYVDSEITNLIGGAPDLLNTLDEIAQAINDDEAFNTTLTNSIATKLPKAGGTMTGAIAMGNNKITGLGTPTADADAATKLYVDDQTTQAETYAANALASANAAAASYDSFDDRYLGSKASDPTLDNDGNALLTGALYFDSTNNVMKVYNGSEWANASSSIEGIKANFYYTATSGQTVFSGADDNTNTLVVDQVDLVNVYMNGVRLHEDDYTVSAAGNSVTLATGAATGDLIYLEVFGNFTGQSGAEVAITGGSITGLSDFGAAQGAFTGNVTFAGNTSYGDNDKAIFGAGSDLQIYHDGSKSLIKDTGVGSLEIHAQNFLVYESTGTEKMIEAIPNAEVNLYFNQSAHAAPKLATTSTGIDVTGTVTADGLTVENDGGTKQVVIANGTPGTQASPEFADVLFTGTSSRDKARIRGVDENTNVVGGRLLLETSDANSTDQSSLKTRVNVDSNGDISFYEDTGTTAQFFWDASAERLGIGTGTNTPSRPLELRDTTPGIRLTDTTAEDYAEVIAVDGDLILRSDHGNSHSGSIMQFLVDGSEAMRIQSSGNVGLQTATDNDLPLNVKTDYYFNSSNNGAVKLNHYLDGDEDVQSQGYLENIGYTGFWHGSRYYGGGNRLLDGSATASSGINIYGDSLRFYTRSGVTQGGVFGMSGAERMRIDSDGHAIIPAGVTLGTSAGVYSAANTLDDYEEGDWTPSMPGLTATVADGKYTKVGSLVTAQFRIQTSSATDSAVAGISGLPFTVTSNSTVGRSAGFFAYNPSGKHLTLLFSSGTSDAAFRESATGSTVTRTDASGHLYFGTLVYRTGQ